MKRGEGGGKKTKKVDWNVRTMRNVDRDRETSKKRKKTKVKEVKEMKEIKETTGERV